MKVRLANTRGMQAAESMLQLTPLAYTHTPLMQLRNHKEGFMKGFMERVKMEFSNRKYAYELSKRVQLTPWKAMLSPQKIVDAAAGNYVHLNRALTILDVDSIKKLASAKISEASIKQLEPMIKRKGNLDQYYSMSDLKAELHYLVTTELDEHIVGQLMARIRGKQIAYSANKSDGRLIIGSREPQQLDEFVYFYFFITRHQSKGQTELDKLWKVFAKRKVPPNE